jgi:hypothetical protein
MAKLATIRAKARAQPEVKKPLTHDEARRVVLGRIRKPYKSAVSSPSLRCVIFLMMVKKKEHKKFFKEFLTRLEARDKELEKTDLEVSCAF